MRNLYKILVRNLKRDHMEDRGIERGDNIKMDPKQIG
jgi:hypothetical protein